MRLERIKCKHLVHAWDISVSDSYIIACTGRRALVLDRQYQLLQSFDGLDYVYAARVSPDEKKLLLISTGNKFYIADLESGQMQKNTVRAPCNYNLEGRGCWSHDGTALLIPVMNSKTLNSALRCYRADDLSQYQDFLPEQYVLHQLHRHGDGKTYLLVGHTRTDGPTSFIHYDGASFTHWPLEDSDAQIILGSDMDPQNGNVTLYTTKGCLRYTAEGKRIDTLHHPITPDDRSAVQENRRVDTGRIVSKYVFSGCGRFHYVASKSGFFVADAQTAEVLAHVPEEYGVQNFEWVELDVIAMATWGGVKLYRVVED